MWLMYIACWGHSLLYFMLHWLKSIICSSLYAIVYIHAVMQGNSSKARVAVSRDHGPHCVTRKRCYIIVHWLAADNHCGVNFDIGDHTQPQVGYHKPGLWSSLLSLATRAVYCKEYVYTRWKQHCLPCSPTWRQLQSWAQLQVSASMWKAKDHACRCSKCIQTKLCYNVVCFSHVQVWRSYSTPRSLCWLAWARPSR